MGKFDYLLPIGTIVDSRGLNKKMMIIGILQNGDVSSDQVFDYVVASYPLGANESGKCLNIKHDDIENVYFRGYESDEWRYLLDVLETNNRIAERRRKISESMKMRNKNRA